MAKSRTALLVRCSEKEAEAIREAANRERRTISGFILNATMNRIAHQHKLETQWQERRMRTGKRKARAANESPE